MIFTLHCPYSGLAEANLDGTAQLNLGCFVNFGTKLGDFSRGAFDFRIQLCDCAFNSCHAAVEILIEPLQFAYAHTQQREFCRELVADLVESVGQICCFDNQ